MSWSICPNVLGGQSLRIEPGTNLSTIPDLFLAVLGDEHRAAFSHPAAYFGRLTDVCALDGLKNWLSRFATTKSCVLQVHIAEVFGTSQTDVLFQRIDGGMSFRLPSDAELGEFPMELQQLYTAIDGTIEFECWEAGGILQTKDTQFNLADYPIRDKDWSNIEWARCFYRSPTGDYLLARGDSAYWWRHEDCQIIEAGSLRSLLDSYFTSSMNGTKWECDPFDP